MTRLVFSVYLYFITTTQLSLSRAEVVITTQKYYIPPESAVLSRDSLSKDYRKTHEDLAEPQNLSNSSKGMFNRSEIDFKSEAAANLHSRNRNKELFDKSHVDFTPEAVEESGTISFSKKNSDALNNTHITISKATLRQNKILSSVNRPFHIVPFDNFTRIESGFPKSGLHWQSWFYNPYNGELAATCYVCGLVGGVTDSYCHDAFNSDDWHIRTFARYSRAECFNGWKMYDVERRKDYTFRGYTYYGQLGLKMQYFKKNFIGGCFKRFLDIDTIHTERGCRKHWPWTRSNVVSHRFGRLEASIRDKKEGCIVSANASLVRFHKGISRFARFHVCVCEGRYCNIASRLLERVQFSVLHLLPSITSVLYVLLIDIYK